MRGTRVPFHIFYLGSRADRLSEGCPRVKFGSQDRLKRRASIHARRFDE